MVKNATAENRMQVTEPIRFTLPASTRFDDFPCQQRQDNLGNMTTFCPEANIQITIAQSPPVLTPKYLQLALLSLGALTHTGCASKSTTSTESSTQNLPRIAVGYPGPTILHRLTGHQPSIVPPESRSILHTSLRCPQGTWGTSTTRFGTNENEEWITIPWPWPSNEQTVVDFLGDPCELVVAECSAQIRWPDLGYQYSLTREELDGVWHAFCSSPDQDRP